MNIKLRKMPGDKDFLFITEESGTGSHEYVGFEVNGNWEWKQVSEFAFDLYVNGSFAGTFELKNTELVSWALTNDKA